MDSNRSIRRRRAGAYVSSVISISLVLMLIALVSLLGVNARKAADFFKENLHMTVLMKMSVDDENAEKCRAVLDTLPFIKTTALITREEGMRDLEKMLGEDFLSVFQTTPVPVSIDVRLKAEYVSPDSLDRVVSIISEYPEVDEISCQQSLVEALNSNMTRISVFLFVLIALMLFISFVLIANTVRVNVFARRFAVHTMKLVGATRSFILAPFIRDALLQGLVSALVAILVMGCGVTALKFSFAQIFDVFTPASFVETCGIVVGSGIIICVVSTWITVNRLVSMGRDELY